MKERIVRSYKKWIGKNEINKVGKICNIRFTDDFIESNDISGEYKTKIEEIAEIIETDDYFYLKTRTTNSCYIIPKAKIAGLESTRNEFIARAKKLKINYIEELNWKW